MTKRASRFERETEARATSTIDLINIVRERDEVLTRLDGAIEQALDAGVPLRHVSELVGISHMTLGKRFGRY